MERSEVEELVREMLEEYLPEQRKKRMLSYKKATPPEADGDGAHLDPDGDMTQDELPEECRSGLCEHPEHASDDDLDAVLG
jgi:hypothetical protein